jgi:hypothetical protein
MSIRTRIGFVVAALPLFLPAALSSAVPDTHDPIEPHTLITHARAVVDELARRGRVDGPVQIEAGRELGSTARADFDFVTGACRVRIDPESAAVQYPDPAALRFLVYHELSHCEFYRRPGGLFRHAGLSGRDARLLDDFVLLDALDADDPEDRLNLFPLAHETYADLRAAALLLEEGAHREVVGRIAAMRSDASFDRYHATGPALARLMDLPPPALAGMRLEHTVRALTGEHVVAVGIGPTFRPTRGFPMAFWQLLESRLGSVQGRLAAGQGHWNAYLGNADAATARLAAYPHLAWAFANRPRADTATRREFIDAWVEGVYGAGLTRAEADAASAAVETFIERVTATRTP